MNILMKLFRRTYKVKAEDIPKIKLIIDKIEQRSGKFYSNPDELIECASEVGFTPDMLSYTAQAFCIQMNNIRVGYDSFREEVVTTTGDDAIEKLCGIKGILSSYILYRVTQLKPISIAMQSCLSTTYETFDFAQRSQRARKELQKRGYDGRDPMLSIIKSNKEV